MYSKDLYKGKKVLVTGGRSGIGYAIAKDFLLHGADVFICSRKEEPLTKAAEELSAFGKVDSFPCDIRKPEQIKELAAQVKGLWGRLDILINNAGGQFPAPAELISENGWASVISNNLNGTFYMSQIMYNEFFAHQEESSIVNIIANMHRGFPGMAHTGAARAGVENLTKTLAQEWAHKRCRINSVAPGTIESSGLSTYPKMIQDNFDRGREENLYKRFGTVEDVSNAVLFYAGPLASYVSGTTLYVDGCEHLASDRMGLLNTLRDMMNE
jgi:citronellol/citronellal dehydrogenase